MTLRAPQYTLQLISCKFEKSCKTNRILMFTNWMRIIVCAARVLVGVFCNNNCKCTSLACAPLRIACTVCTHYRLCRCIYVAPVIVRGQQNRNHSDFPRITQNFPEQPRIYKGNPTFGRVQNCSREPYYPVTQLNYKLATNCMHNASVHT